MKKSKYIVQKEDQIVLKQDSAPFKLRDAYNELFNEMTDCYLHNGKEYILSKNIKVLFSCTHDEDDFWKKPGAWYYKQIEKKLSKK